MTGEITGKLVTYVEVDVDVFRITRFEAARDGEALANWTLAQGENTTLLGIDDDALPSGKGARLLKTSSSAHVVWQWTRTPSIADVSVIALLRSQISAEDMGVIVRNTGVTVGYLLRLNGNTIEIRKGASGSFSLLTSVAFDVAADDSVWLRFDAATVDGPAVLLRAKVWRGALSDEPSTWSLSHMDSSSPLTAAGPVGLYTNTNGSDVLCGHFRVKSLLGSETETLRHAKQADYLPRAIEACPDLIDATLTPATISLGEDLGERATLAVTLADHSGSDFGELWGNGTHWGKARARQILRRGQEVRVKRGLLDWAFADYETRTYTFDSLSGPAAKGAVSWIAKDPLKLADNDRALAPVQSNGYLVADILASAGEATLSPAGIGDEEYEASGKAAIGGKEIVYYSRDPYTKLLLEFNGTDGATVTSDVKVANPHAVTFVGSAQLDTAQKKFGTASLLLGASGNYISLADSDDWSLGAGNFTIDIHCRFTTVPSGAANGSFDNILFWQFVDNNNRVIAGFDGTTIIFLATAGGVAQAGYSATHGMSNATWHHFRFVRSGSSFFIFRDGVALSLTTVTAISTNSLPNLATALVIGGVSSAGADWVDNFRWRKGIADTTSGFTAPTGEYELTATGDVIRLTRAQDGTEASDHDAEDRVQVCEVIDGMDAADIAYYLLTEYAGVSPSIIPLATWQLETATYLQRVYSRIIAEPTGVNDLLAELVKQAGLAIWYDDLLGQLRLQVLRGIPVDAFVYDEATNIIKGSLQVTDQPEKQITQVITRYGVRNPLEPLDQANNFRSARQQVDLEVETETGSKIVKVVDGTWIPPFAADTAERTNSLQIGRFVRPPRRFVFEVMRHSAVEEPQAGGGYRIIWAENQDEAGDIINTPIQVTRVNPMDDRFRVEAEEMLFKIFDVGDLINRTITFDSNVNSVDVNTYHNSIYGVLTAQDIIGGVNLVVNVSSGVIVGSSLTSIPALSIGTWPTAPATGNTTNASPIITNLSIDPTDMYVGAPVTGAGIQANSRILTIDSATQVTLTKNATATATGAVLEFQIYIKVNVLGRGQGRGGNGGNGNTHVENHQNGFPGGAALYARHYIDLDDSAGELFGGGGGGAGGGSIGLGGGGGGGGAGKEPGAGGASHSGASVSSAAGTTEAGGAPGSMSYGNAGGAGGGPGLAGSNSTERTGGAPGLAIDGISYVTTIGPAGDRRGGTAN